MDRITLVGGGRPAIPEGFRERLRALDPTLCVRWNQPPPWSKKPPRFIIEQCVKHYAIGAEHDHTCQRLYVFLVQDAEGGMMPLGDAVLEEIKSRDVQRAGYGPNDLDRFIREHQEQLDANREQITAAQADSVRHASRFNRRQLLKAVHLIQQHDVCRINQ